MGKGQAVPGEGEAKDSALSVVMLCAAGRELNQPLCFNYTI